MIKARKVFNALREFIERKPALCAKIAATAVMCCTVLTYISCLSARDIVTVAYANGEYLGIVSDGCDIYTSALKATSDAAVISYPAPDVPVITLDVRPVRKGDTPLNNDTAYKALYDTVLSDYEMMHALFVDNKFVAANSDDKVLSSVTAAIEEGIRLQAGGNVEITSDIAIKKLYCNKAYAPESDRIVSYLSEGLSYNIVLDTEEEVFEFFFEDEAEHALAPNLSSPQGNGGLSTDMDNKDIQTKIITATEEIPFATVYEENDELFIGVYSKKNDGRPGVRSVTVEITFENGVEVSRKVIEERIITPATDKVLYAGTRPAPTTASSGSYIIPLPKGSYMITDRYGERELYGKWTRHYGIDLAADKGVTVMAADGGTVIRAENSSSYGKCVTIRHDNGHETLYAHMSKITVSEGDKVYQGQKIGEVGRTGLATGNHLHLELFIHGNKVDPEDYIDF